jgi:hypothetical protein
MYLYKYPEDTVPKGGEGAYIKTLSTDCFGYTLDVTVIGLTENSKYFDARPEKGKNKAVINNSLSERYGYKKGDRVTFTDTASDQDYSFTVTDIVQYSPGFTVFMDIDSMRELFGDEEDHFNAVYSKNELDIDSGRLYSVTSKADIEKNGMGTTVVASLVINKKIYVVSVGDSRAYLLNKDGIKQITTDHTYVEMLYRNGEITEEQKETHELRNVITRAVGVEADVDVDYFELEEYGNFSVVLCSDGLSKYCSSELIYGTVFEKDLDEAVKTLVEYANDKGGKDNISAAIVAN